MHFLGQMYIFASRLVYFDCLITVLDSSRLYFDPITLHSSILILWRRSLISSVSPSQIPSSFFLSIFLPGFFIFYFWFFRNCRHFYTARSQRKQPSSLRERYERRSPRLLHWAVRVFYFPPLSVFPSFERCRRIVWGWRDAEHETRGATGESRPILFSGVVPTHNFTHSHLLFFPSVCEPALATPPFSFSPSVLWLWMLQTQKFMSFSDVFGRFLHMKMWYQRVPQKIYHKFENLSLLVF